MLYLFEEYEFDCVRYELRRGGQIVALEPQVFDLLLYLIEHHSRLVTKDELIGSIWKDRVISESTLSTRINAARRAIGDSGQEQRLIRTVARRGFRFVGDIEVLAPPGKRVNGEIAAELSAQGSVPAITIVEALGTPDMGESPARIEQDCGPTSSDSATSPEFFCGSFACYSYAWSPASAGLIVRAALTISKPGGASSELSASYSESLSFADLRYVGQATALDRTLYLDLADRNRGSRVFVNLLWPGAPASAMLGLMSGRAYHDPNEEIVTSRLLVVRVPPARADGLESSNGYLDPGVSSITGDLVAAGLPVEDDDELEAEFLTALKGRRERHLTRIATGESRRINVALDMALNHRARG